MAGMEPLSEKTVGEIDALAKKISVAHGLDAEIQAELRGHVEDKVRGYVRGEVKVSEADALLLATAHFGEAGVVKALFQEVHASAHGVSLARRLAAAFAASLGAVIAMAIAMTLWGILVMYPIGEMTETLQTPFPTVLFIGFLVLPAVLEIFFLWRILSYWRRRQAQGRPVWFETYRPRAILGIFAMLYVAVVAVKWVEGELWRLFDFGWTLAHVYGSQLAVHTSEMISWGFSPVCGFLSVLVWLWWADRTPRTMRTLLLTVVCWLVAALTLSIVGTLPFLLSLAQRGSLFSRPDIFHVLLLSMAWRVGLNLVIGGIALVSYRAIKRPGKIGLSA
jgi:hypothetical protein